MMVSIWNQADSDKRMIEGLHFGPESFRIEASKRDCFSLLSFFYSELGSNERQEVNSSTRQLVDKTPKLSKIKLINNNLPVLSMRILCIEDTLIKQGIFKEEHDKNWSNSPLLDMRQPGPNPLFS